MVPCLLTSPMCASVGLLDHGLHCFGERQLLSGSCHLTMVSSMFRCCFGGGCRREHHTPHQAQTEKATSTPKCPAMDARPGSFSKPAIFEGRGGARK